MLQAKNSVPLIFLGAISGTFVLLSIYHFWFKRNQLRTQTDEEAAIEYDSHGEQIIGETELKSKKKTPKMWDVRIPRLGRSNHEPSLEEDDDDDELDEKDAGKWDTIKPMSVAYIKNRRSSPPSVPVSPMPPYRASTPPLSPNRPPMYAQHRPSYDKTAIEAVQVSVLISMPSQAATKGTNMRTAGPLELGVAKISLDNDRKWSRRASTRV